MLKIWIDECIEETFLARFQVKIQGTIFEGAELVPTGENKKENLYNPRQVEYLLVADKIKHLEIPGHKFLGIAEFDNGQTLFNSFNTEIDLHTIPNIEASRCDICHVRHNRNKVFILENLEEKSIVVVGGSCAKKFRTIDLEQITLRIFREFDKFISDMYNDEEVGRIKTWRDLSREIAIGEFIINKNGYVSRSNAEISGKYATASELESIVYNPKDAKITKEEWKGIYNRSSELTKDGFKEHIEYIQNLIQEKPSDFLYNCLSILKGNMASKIGYTAYLANVMSVKKTNELSNNEKPKGLSVETNKMMNLGKFTILTKKFDGNNFGTYYSLTALNDNNEKIWFKVATTSNTCEKISQDNVIGKVVDIRGKVSENKSEISFVKNVKILSCE
jgi:hypothetical protein